jgi:hypothetical protein
MQSGIMELVPRRAVMRYGVFALALLSAVFAIGTPAHAHVVQATTSVSLADLDADDAPQLERVLRSAVDELISDTIAFTPTLVALTDARVVDDRLYVRVLIADDDGVQTLKALQGSTREDRDSPSTIPTPAPANQRTEL